MFGRLGMADPKGIAVAVMAMHQMFSRYQSEVPLNPEVFPGMEKNAHRLWQLHILVEPIQIKKLLVRLTYNSH